MMNTRVDHDSNPLITLHSDSVYKFPYLFGRFHSTRIEFLIISNGSVLLKTFTANLHKRFTCIIEHSICQHSYEEETETGASPLYRREGTLDWSEKHRQPDMAVIKALL